MIERHGDRGPKTERYDESQRRDDGSGFAIPSHKPDIDLETDEE